MLAESTLDWSALITVMLPLSDYEKVFRLTEEKHGFKIMFDMEK